MLLRPRQKELVSKTVEALLTHGNTLAVAPTGSGKTIMLSAVLGELFEKDKRKGLRPKACVLAHRDELTGQNEAKFKRVNPSLSTSVFNANEKSWEGVVTFAMVQTLAREANLELMPPLDVLVIDEAHHARAESYMRVIEHARQGNPHLKLLGMTATPMRGDKKGLRPIFSNVADQITVKELIASGHLVPPKTFVMNVGVQDELSQVRKVAQDFDMGAVATIMNKRPINDAVVTHWKEKAGDRQTVVFCSTVEHAEDVTDSFREAGVKASMIWGDMTDTERQNTLEEYAHGNVQVIVNVAVLTEGWDHPPTSCVVLLRPSSHKSTLSQMIGRGLRIVDPQEHPGVIKEDCIVLDFGTSTLIHGSLEQEVQLELQIPKSEAPYKECPECKAQVPLAVKECPLCSYIWEVQYFSSEPVETADFVMTEIDLLKRSNFLWCDISQETSVVAGFKAWGCVMFSDGQWHAVGGCDWEEEPELLATGSRIVCFAAADDWMNVCETENTAHKTRSWLHESATERQLQYLPQKYRNDYSLTRYKASALITLQFNQKNIQKILGGYHG